LYETFCIYKTFVSRLKKKDPRVAQSPCPTFSAIAAVLPTGRNFGRKTQKWPHKNVSGRKNPLPNFWQIFIKLAEKWPNFFISVLLT
jgi:hypothetical protein